MPDDPKVYVTPLHDAAPAAPPEKEPETPAPAASQEAPETPSPAEPVDGNSHAPEAKADPPKADAAPAPKTEREKLIDSLTGVEEPPAPEPEDDDDEDPEKAPAAPAPDADPKAEKADPPPEEGDLTELTNDSAKAMKPGEVRRKINRLITRIKQAEPMAGLGRDIVTACEKHQLAPADYKAWVAIGLGLHVGNPEAIEELRGIAAKVGITAPAAAPAGLTSEVEQWIDAQVKDLEMSAAAAAELRKRLAPPKPAAAPAPAPAPAPAAPAPVATPSRPPVDARAQAVARATADIDRAAALYEQQIGAQRFAELAPRLRTALAQRKGAPPEAWLDIFRAAVEIELAKAPKPKAVGTPLRPGTTSTSAKPVFKSARERLIHEHTTG